VHDDDAWTAAKKPAAHATHMLALEEARYWPAGQDEQLEHDEYPYMLYWYDT